MSRFFSFVLWILITLGFASSARSQTTEPRPTAPPGNTVSKNKAAANAEAERLLKERRAQARSLLISLASDARSFRDQAVRARSLARIADALWSVDAEEGRTLFRKAWEAAEVADFESDQKFQEELQRQRAKTGGALAYNLPPNLRREVLRLAARRDRALGEEFLEKLKAQKQENASDKTKPGPSNLSDALSQRLDVALELLNAGDMDRGLQFADPALGSVNVQTIDFLSNLRDKNPAAADARYASMLANANANTQADANTVSLLSSYIFTPHLFVMFNRSGGVSSMQTSSTIAPPGVAPELRAAFLQTAAGILMRPQLPPDQDQSTSSVEGKYLVLKRLLPLFDQFASAEMAGVMRGQLDALNAVVSDNARQRDDEWIRRSGGPEKPVEDQERSLLDRIERAKTSAERDGLYLQMAFMAMSRGDMRARDFVGKIDESEMRKEAQAYIDAGLATNAVSRKETEKALELVRTGELTHIQKSWVLSQCAKLLATTDRDKSLSLLEEARSEAQRIGGSNPDRPRALMAIATVLMLIDPARAWDATFEAVKAANSAEGFTGEDGELNLTFHARGSSAAYTNDVPDFDVAGIFGKLAEDDYDRTVQLARGFQNEAPRANATIAIARSALKAKAGSNKLPQPPTKN